MAILNRMPPWHEQVRLPNGREILIRPIRPEDAGPMQAAFTLLKPDEIRQRFLHPMKELGTSQVDLLVRPDPRRDFALVAAEPLPPGEALVGAVARISIDTNNKDAEFAILVSHYVNGMGLGRRMMRKLVRWARGQKVERLYGDVFDQNHPMLALCESLGFVRQRDDDSPGLIRVMLDLREQHPDEDAESASA